MSGAISSGLSGAAEGAAVGSIVPGIGTAIGGVAGAIGGIVQGLIGSQGASAQNAANQIIAAEQISAQQQSQSNAQAFADTEAQKAEQYNTNMSVWQEEMTKENMGLAYNYNLAGQKQQQDYETQMSNTAYQRMVADMKAAGLNPILGVSSGGASTPATSSPGVANIAGPSTPGAPSPTSSGIPGAAIPMVNAKAALAQGLGDAFSSAGNIAKLYQGLQQGAANIQNTQAQTAATQAQADLAKAQLPGTQAKSQAAQLEPAQAQQALENAQQALRNAQATFDQINSATSLNGAQAAAAAASADASRAQSRLTGDTASYLEGTHTLPSSNAATSTLEYGGQVVNGILSGIGNAIKQFGAPSGHSAKSNQPDVQIQSITRSSDGQPLYNAIPQ